MSVEIEIDESDIDEYEEVQEALANYNQEGVKLNELIERRAEMVSLLKIAQPSKIGEVRKAVAGLDNLIEMTEGIIEKSLEIVEQHRQQVREYKRLDAMTQMILPELRKHLAETDPEKLEQLDAMLDPQSDKTH